MQIIVLKNRLIRVSYTHLHCSSSYSIRNSVVNTLIIVVHISPNQLTLFGLILIYPFLNLASIDLERL